MIGVPIDILNCLLGGIDPHLCRTRKLPGTIDNPRFQHARPQFAAIIETRDPLQEGIGVICHIARAGHAVGEIERAIVVTEMLVIVPQPRHQELIMRVDNLRVRRWFKIGVRSDAHGRFLMPGLWDNHQHFSDVEGALDLANGVTSARDMANDTDNFLKRVARFDDGSELGPRVLKAGIIDGTGEFAGPTKMRVDTAEQAIQDVDWYADHGYAQIKIYSSVKPELVPIIADRAHARGLRVSGHVPAFMSARQFVEGGADEIQHLNFIELNFLFPEVKETRNRDRFIKVAEHAREFTPDKPEVRDFIAFLKQHHTVLDPTVSIFEALFCGDPAVVTPGLEGTVLCFPSQIRRSMLSGALEVPKGKEAAYHEAFPAMLRLLKALYDAGITIIPGTDALAGYTLHHELELYVRAGIAPAEVLRMATLTPALVMGVNKDRGVIAAGKLADMLLIDGDPTQNIRDLNKIATVIKGGKVYDAAAIEKALGIAPRQAGQ